MLGGFKNTSSSGSEKFYEKEIFMESRSKKSAKASRREIIIMRHAERVDDIFNTWSDIALKNGSYFRFDINMPDDVQMRSPEMLESYIRWTCDPPITVNGKEMARSMGKLFASRKKNIYAIYSSPAVRCVQTANAFAESYGKFFPNRNLSIRVEGGLYDFIHENMAVVPNFIDLAELKQWKLNVDMKYKSVIEAENMTPDDFRENYANYCKSVFDSILNKVKKNCAVLIVTHAPCFAAFRTYIHRPIKNQEKMMKTIQSTPYLFMLNYMQMEYGKWEPIPPPVESFCHKGNK